MPEPLVSLVVPSYNEARTIAEVVRRAVATDLSLEIIVVDDGSTDGTAALLESLRGEVPALVVLRRGGNRGQGAAGPGGIAAATGGFVGVPGADPGSDPQD